MDANQAQQAADRLSAKLDDLDLDPDERAVLEAICAAGADSVEDGEGEVEGFAVDAFQWFQDSNGKPLEVTLDMRKAGGDPKSSGQPFLQFKFSTVFISG